MTYLLKTMYEKERDKLLKFTCNKILGLNREYGTDLSLPSNTPIYVNKNYKVQFKVGYEKYFTPYVFDITKFGVPIEGNDENTATLHLLPPGSKMFCPEGQKFINSYEWKKLPKETRTGFEEHRQWWLDFWFDVQRPIMIAAPVREIAGRFIRILKLEKMENFAGGVESVTFHTLEFSSWQEADANYQTGSTAGGEYKQYTHIGNLLKCYDSYSCRDDFMKIATAHKRDFIYQHWDEANAA